MGCYFCPEKRLHPLYAKEINEQPESIAKGQLPKGIQNKTSDGTLLIPDFTVDGIPDDLFSGCDRIIITACGTAMHAGMVGRMLLSVSLEFQLPLKLPLSSDTIIQSLITAP